MSPNEAYAANAGQPVVLRAEERPLFAFHHAPKEPSTRSTGIVLCGPLGYESLCAYRTYRHAAEELCNAGFHVLRFDYYGTGNSGGTGDETVGCAEDVAAAIDGLKQLSGLQTVCLVGVRAGALFALKTAAARSDVNSLALWATPPSGRAYVRELKAFQAMSLEPNQSERGLRVAGFSMGSPLLAELSEIDTRALTFPGHLHILILARDDLAGSEHSADHWREAGHDVVISPVPGYAAMMSTAESSIVPTQAIACLRDWAVSAHSVVDHVATGLGAEASTVMKDADGLTEQGVHFGPQARLFGIVARPGPNLARTDGRCVILTNTGANHHIGSGRLTVTLARALARSGLTVLRFDFAGLGESRVPEGRAENEIYPLDTASQVAQAMRFMKQHFAAQRFVLAGICAGAFAAYRTAVKEPDVEGIALVNLAVFEQPKAEPFERRMARSFRARREYLRRARDPNTWRRLLSGRVAAIPVARHLLTQTVKRSTLEAKRLMRGIFRKDAAGSKAEAEFHGMCERGVRILMVYAREDAALDVLSVYLGPLGKHLRRHRNFRVELIPDADHTFTRLAAQQELLPLLVHFATY